MNTVLVVGFACAYIWYLLAVAHITEPVMAAARARDDWVGLLITCPWCSGFWLAGVLLLVSGNYDPMTHLATACVVGVVGTLTA